MIEGIIPALVTPFDESENISFDKAKKLIDYVVTNGVNGLFILGTNGEFQTISNDEAVKYAKEVIEYVRGKVPVFVGVGTNSTIATIELGKRMIEEAHAEYFTVITPYFASLSQDEVENYFNDVANSLKKPMLIYNMPARTGINVEPSTLAKLMNNPYIIGIKDSSGNMENLQGYIDVSSGKDFSVLCGSDSKILTALKMGAAGAVASTSNLIPQVITAIYKNYKNGNFDEAQDNQEELEKLRLLMKKASVPAVLKKSLNIYGIDVGDARKPVMPVLSEELINEIKDMLRYYGMR